MRLIKQSGKSKNFDEEQAVILLPIRLIMGLLALFVSKYQLYLPNKEELRAAIEETLNE